MIQQLAIHTTGGVVTEAQPLMIVVPESGRLTAEVSISNQYIGCVTTRQITVVNLKTFPYIRYAAVLRRSTA